MIYFQSLVAIVTGIVFLVIAGSNAWLWIAGSLGRARGSTAPLLGGIAGAVCLLSIPVESFHRWWWLPLFADVGTIPLFFGVLIFALVGRIRRK